MQLHVCCKSLDSDIQRLLCVRDLGHMYETLGRTGLQWGGSSHESPGCSRPEVYSVQGTCMSHDVILFQLNFLLPSTYTADCMSDFIPTGLYF